MPDVFTPEQRSALMARVKGGDTKPEKLVRSLLHRMGYRFRLRRKDLPGKPDIVLPKYKTVIFVHGCFWHGHADCPRAKRPTSNTDFWNSKIDGNIQRDAKVQSELASLGWNVITVWQCQLRNIDDLSGKMAQIRYNRHNSV